ncbi:MAG: LicD family protein [Lachnospiraceae bacterium]|nr:LicD family protein [Lachnospiraceae bacterium]
MKKFEERIARIKKEIESVPIVSWEEIAEAEVRCNLIEKHKELLELLICVDKICRENGIGYSIAYGTLLGALRHGEFIPWDDDADVMMTRAEFEKFKKVVKGDEAYKLFKVLFTDRFATKESFEKDCFIDIFVFDPAPASEFKRFTMNMVSRMFRFGFFSGVTYQERIKKKRGLGRFLFAMEYYFCRAIGRLEKAIWGSKMISMHEKMITGNYKKSSEYALSHTGTWQDVSRTYRMEWFENLTEMNLCGYSFLAIANPEDFLINRYGNYKSVPEPEARVPLHDLGIEAREDWQIVFDL